jgi:hypothetical protein
MQTDLIGYADGMNWYDYVGNEPINGKDPTGKFFVENGRKCSVFFCAHTSFDKSNSSNLLKSNGWQKNGTTSDGLARFSFTGSNSSNSGTAALGNGIIGYGGQIASQVIVNQDGNWLGKNFKYNAPTWGGNGATGGRTLAHGKVNSLKLLGRASFLGSAGLSAYNYMQPDGPSLTKTSVDIGMAALGFVWPIGTIVSASYFMVDLSNSGDWSRRPVTTF